MKVKFSVIKFIVLIFILINCATFHKGSELTPEQKKLNIESFEYIWKTIDENHFDPTFSGINWQAVYDSMRPKIEKAKTQRESRIVMIQMIDVLGLSHFNIIPSELFQEMGETKDLNQRNGTTGIDVRVINSQALITSVATGSAAELANIQTGWEILEIDDIKIPPLFPKLEKEFAGKSWKNMVLSSVVKARLAGPIGESINLIFLDEKNQQIENTLQLKEPKGNRFQFGYLSPFYINIEADTIEKNIGYISFNGFLDPANVMPAFNKAIEDFMNFKGIIIDIRGNPGGIIGMTMGMSGWFISEKNKLLGTMYMRNNNLKCIVRPRPNIYSGKLAILIDGLSGSSSEIFSGGLKDNNRAKIFGITSAGAALPSQIEKLPNGDAFQYAMANYVSTGGKILEGIGVNPHVNVQHTKETLLEGRDIILETAVNWIHNQNSSSEIINK